MPIAQLDNKEIANTYQQMIKNLDKDLVRSWVESIFFEKEIKITKEQIESIIDIAFSKNSVVSKALIEQIISENTKNQVVVLEISVKKLIDMYKNKLSEHEIQQIIDMDPSPTKKYSQWMIKRYIEEHPVMSYMKGLIEEFHDYANRKLIKGQDADIFRYKTLERLQDKLAEVDPVSKSQMKKTVVNLDYIDPNDVVYENDKVVVVEPKDWKSSCKYGYSSWCTASTNPLRNQWANYRYQNNYSIYYLIPKIEIPKEYTPTAILVGDDGHYEVYSRTNAYDNRAREGGKFYEEFMHNIAPMLGFEFKNGKLLPVE